MTRSADTEKPTPAAKDEPAKAAPRIASAEPIFRAVIETDTKAPAAPKDDSGGRIIASPLARRIAEQKGVDLRA